MTHFKCINHANLYVSYIPILYIISTDNVPSRHAFMHFTENTAQPTLE